MSWDKTSRRTLYICRLAQRQEFISASTTFHSVSSRRMPVVSYFPFGIMTRIVCPNSWGVYHVRHMLCTRSTRHAQPSLQGGA